VLNALRVMKPGGTVVVDDCHNEEADVGKGWKQVGAQGELACAGSAGQVATDRPGRGQGDKGSIGKGWKGDLLPEGGCPGAAR
jgi:hypothetical protein